MMDIFPALRDKLGGPPSMLSGGQQQMVAIARALISKPLLVVCDEVSLGLAPKMVDTLYESLDAIRSSGTAVLLIEQNVTRCLHFADRVYVLDRGVVSYAGDPAPLHDPGVLATAYFGKSAE
jgi:branched-chain amino acid transport system ATP-binding protein